MASGTTLKEKCLDSIDSQYLCGGGGGVGLRFGLPFLSGLCISLTSRKVVGEYGG